MEAQTDSSGIDLTTYFERCEVNCEVRRHDEMHKKAGRIISSGFFREAACNDKSIPDDSPESGRIEKFVDILFVREKV